LKVLENNESNNLEPKPQSILIKKSTFNKLVIVTVTALILAGILVEVSIPIT